MIITEIYDGQGLGNQLWCYVTTRVIATDKGFDFGVQSPEKLKCLDFLDLDLGLPVIGGTGPEGGPPRQLPEGIQFYYNERRIDHPDNGVDIRTYDPNLVAILDGTKIDGIMQDEQYILHRREEIRQWLKIKESAQCHNYSSDDICVINFRGGEYKTIPNVFLPQHYWDTAIAEMQRQNPLMRFVVITDDITEAKKFFPEFEVYHFSIAKDYVVISNAHYLILSNSSFACLPAWLNQNLKFCIAPKYWSQYNTSDGFWGCSYNMVKGWHYLDRQGQLFDYDACHQEFQKYQSQHLSYFQQVKIKENFLVISNYYNDLSWVPEYAEDYLIYDQSTADIYPPQLNQDKVIKSLHRGHNIRDYCTYIIDHYDQLPERIIFTTGNVFPLHIRRPKFDTLINNQYYTPLEDVKKYKEHWPISFFSSDGGFCEINNSWYLRYHPTKYFHSYNDFLRFCFVDPVYPRYIRFAPGANYIVPKENILKFPKVFYENIRLFVSHTDQAIPGESHILERAFHTLWTSSFTPSKNMLQKLDESFAPAQFTWPKKQRLVVMMQNILQTLLVKLMS